jgi:MFS family permease
LGILVVLIALPMAFFIREPSRETNGKVQPAVAVPISSILRNPNFYLLAVGSMCSIGAVGSIVQHLKLYLRDLDYSQANAAQVASIMMFSSLAGRVLMGFLADLINRKYVMILIYLIVACTIPLLLLPDFPGRVYLFAFIFGIGLGGDYMIIPLMAADLFGIRALGRTMGIILVADGIAESLFPMLVGHLYDISTNGYTVGFTFLIGLALMGAVIVSFLPKTQIAK